MKHGYCHKKSGWYNLWLNQLNIIALNCSIDNLRLLWNKKNKSYSNNLGVSTRIPYSHGSTKGMRWLDPNLKLGKPFYSNLMRTLVKGLEAAGGKRNISIRGFPYDWRYAPSLAFLNGLTSLVESTYRINNNTRVTLLTYSMGCNYALWFLNRKGRTYVFGLPMFV